jgi:uncharacterized protein (UPF0210 family)
MTLSGCRWTSLLLLMLAGCTFSARAQDMKPKVRALTAFVRIDPGNYQTQVHDALTLLRSSKDSFVRRGYEVQTLRITTQPFPEIVRGLSQQQAMDFFRALDGLAARESFIANIGPAMPAAGDSASSAELLARVLAQNEHLLGSVIVGREDGIDWNAVRSAARIVKYLEEYTPHGDGNFRFAVSALLAPYGPFYPTSYYTGADHRFSIGLEGANVVQVALGRNPRDLAKAEKALTEALGGYAIECEQIAREIEKNSSWTYAGLDPTPAPAGDVSIGDAIEKFAGAKFGSSGTMTVAAMITRAVKSVPVKQVGFAGLMVPVLEDSILAQRWSEGTYNIDSLMAYSAVCGTGLDTVPLPGAITEEHLARIIGDVATLAYKWNKPLSARLLPAPGKKASERTEFGDPRLANAVLQALP